MSVEIVPPKLVSVDESSLTVDLSHHITAVNVERQAFIEQYPSVKYGGKVDTSKVAWLFPSQDPALTVFKNASVGVLPAPKEPAAKGSWLGDLATDFAASLKLDFNHEPLLYADKALPAKGLFEDGFLRDFRTSEELLPFFEHLMAISFAPPYKGWKVEPTGKVSTMWLHVLQLLVGPGDVFICNSVNSGVPLRRDSSFPEGAIPISVDYKNGFIDLEILQDLLENWSTSVWGKRGLRKPRVVALSAISGLSDKLSTLYALAQKHDLILVESETDSFLSARHARAVVQATVKHPGMQERYLLGLRGKTLLELDTDGRVIRLDSLKFTTDMCTDLGWVTCSPLFHKHLKRIARSPAHACIGIAEYVIANTILGNWGGIEGYFKRLIDLGCNLAGRADAAMTVLEKRFELKPVGPEKPYQSYECFSKRASLQVVGEKSTAEKRPLLTISIGPACTMLRVRLHLERHWKLANISRLDDEHTKVSRHLLHELTLHLVSKQIYLALASITQGNLSRFVDGPSSEAELQEHFLSPTTPLACVIVPNPVGYKLEEREAMGVFTIGLMARPVAEMSKSIDRFLDELEVWFGRI